MKHFVNLARVAPSHHARIWNTIRRRLVRLLSRVEQAAMEHARIHLVIHPADRAPGGWTARLRIQIEDALLTFVERGAERPNLAVRGAFDQAERGVRAHLRGRGRKRRAWRSRRSGPQREGRPGLAAEPGADAIRMLQGRVGWLYRVARDVLERGEAEDRPGWPSLMIDDLVDETLVRAWEGFDARPDQASVDVWLKGILDKVVAEQCAESLACEPLEDIAEAAGDEELPYEPACWQVARSDPPGVALWEDREDRPGGCGRADRRDREAPIRRGGM